MKCGSDPERKKYLPGHARLETVSASKVRKASALMATRPYANKAWKVLKHVAEQPGRKALHPLLQTVKM